MPLSEVLRRLKSDALSGQNMARLLSVLEMFGLDLLCTRKRGLPGVGVDFTLVANRDFRGELRCLDSGLVSVRLVLDAPSRTDCEYLHTVKVKTEKDRLKLTKELRRIFQFMGFRWMPAVA